MPELLGDPSSCPKPRCHEAISCRVARPPGRVVAPRLLKRRLVPALLGVLAAAFAVSATAAPAQAGPPDWFRAEMAQLTAHGGVWVSDNSANRSEEPFDAYGLEWAYGLGEQSMKGRLFGLRDGEEVATLWEYRAFWHPAEERVVLLQFGGDGTFGSGTMEPDGDGGTRAEQTFFRPDGSTFRLGHLQTSPSPGERHSRAYLIDESGEWRLQRESVWVLQR